MRALELQLPLIRSFIRFWQELSFLGAAGDLFGWQKRRLLRLVVSTYSNISSYVHSFADLLRALA